MHFHNETSMVVKIYCIYIPKLKINMYLYENYFNETNIFLILNVNLLIK